MGSFPFEQNEQRTVLLTAKNFSALKPSDVVTFYYNADQTKFFEILLSNLSSETHVIPFLEQLPLTANERDTADNRLREEAGASLAGSSIPTMKKYIIHIPLKYSSTFEKRLLPYLLNGENTFATTEDNEDEWIDQEFHEAYFTATFLGMSSLLCHLRRTVAKNLDKVMECPFFRKKYISSDELTSIFLWYAFFYESEVNYRHMTNIRLHALLHWLRDSPMDECHAMNKLFAAKFECSWANHIHTFDSNQVEIFVEKFSDSVNKFFQASELVQLIKTGNCFKTCIRCGIKVHRQDVNSSICVLRKKHPGQWLGGYYSCCWSSDEQSEYCKESAEVMHRFKEL